MFSSRGGFSFPRKGDSPFLLDRRHLTLTGLSLDFLGGGVKFMYGFKTYETRGSFF